MKKFFSCLTALVAAFCLIAFAACGGDGQNDDQKVAVTGVSLDKAEGTLKIGETLSLSATVAPANATEKTVTWTSSAPAVATVQAGTVTAVSTGTAEITATAGGKSAKCTVTVLHESDRIAVGETEYETLEAAITGAAEGDVIEIANGEYTFGETVSLNKRVTLRGEAGYTVFKTDDPTALFDVTAEDVVIEGIDFVKTDKTVESSFAMLSMRANGFTVKNCTFTAQYAAGDNEVTRAIVPNAGVTGYLIEGNTFRNIRQPAYLEGAGTVRNNHTEGTRGFVVCCNHEVTFEGNTFASNAVDIAIIANGSVENKYDEADTVNLSAENHGALVDNQVLGIQAKDGKKVEA